VAMGHHVFNESDNTAAPRCIYCGVAQYAAGFSSCPCAPDRDNTDAMVELDEIRKALPYEFSQSKDYQQTSTIGRIEYLKSMHKSLSEENDEAWSRAAENARRFDDVLEKVAWYFHVSDFHYGAKFYLRECAMFELNETFMHAEDAIRATINNQ
jgi:hypothetical protein